ncbi:MAG: hypothetical protein K8M05_02765 [Deltaproteobacteria bacterium]|nr:hypothetical protein [Kofleriaceae bacterium]
MGNLIGAVSGRIADFTIGTAIVMVHVVLANRRTKPDRRDRKSNFLLPMKGN